MTDEAAGTSTERRPTLSVRRGAMWMLVGTILQLGLRFASVPILARLIPPEPFGVFAAVFVLSEVVELVAGLGLNQAVIRTDNLSKEMLHGFYGLMAALGLVVGCSFHFGAEVIAHLLKLPTAGAPAVAAGWVAALGLLASPGQAILSKSLRFGEIALVDITSALLGTTVGILVAFLAWDMGALIVQVVLTAVVRLLMTLWLTRSYFGISLRMGPMRELATSGVAQLVSRGLLVSALRLDSVVVGRTLGGNELGFYQRSSQLTTIMGAIVWSAIGRIIMPAAATLRSAPAELRATFSTSVALLVVVLPPMALVSAILAPEIVRVALGETWQGLVPSYRVFSAAFLIFPITLLVQPLIQANGRMRTFIPLQLGNLGSVLVAAYVGAKLAGIVGASIGVMVTRGVFVGIVLVNAGRICDVSTPSLLLRNAPLATMATVSAGTVAWLTSQAARGMHWGGAWVLCAAGVASGVVTCAVLVTGSRLYSRELIQSRRGVDRLVRRMVGRLQHE